MDTDAKLAELKNAIESYKAAPRASDPLKAFDFTALLTLLPVLLTLFVKDAALRDVLTKIISLVLGLFGKENA